MTKFSNYFWNNLKAFSDNTALVDTAINKSITYKELENESQTLAEKLELPAKGMIFLFTTNNIESIITYIAALKSGNAVLLLDEKLNDEIRNGLIENYKPDYIISSSNVIPKIYINSFNYNSLNFYKRIEKTTIDIYPEISVLLSTSGTTGSPKLVKLSYKNIQSNAESIAEYLQIDESEKPITTLPLSYSYGLSIINSHLVKRIYNCING